MVEKQMDNEGIFMMLNDQCEASFWLNGEKIKFESSSRGWKMGDKVAYVHTFSHLGIPITNGF